jgi:hypothetical protein
MAYTTTNGGALTLPQTTLVVASVAGFLSSGTINVTTSLGAQQVTYGGTQTSPSIAFTGCSGGSGSFTTGAVVTQSQDQGLSIGLTPEESLISPAMGLPGNPPSSYSISVFNAVSAAYPNDFNQGRDWGSTFNTISQNLPTAISTPTTYYLMRAYESGGSCSGNVPRTWVVINAPDLTGAYYTGARCSPTPGTLSNFHVLAVW